MKLVNESLSDILKPRKKEDILKDLGGEDVQFKRTDKDPSKKNPYLIGILENISYKTLVDLFGEPDIFRDNYKITMMWDIEDEFGNLYEIYEYKSSKNFFHEYPSIDEIKNKSSFDWHVSGNKGPSYMGAFNEININPHLINLTRFILKNSINESLNDIFKGKDDNEIFLKKD